MKDKLMATLQDMSRVAFNIEEKADYLIEHDVVPIVRCGDCVHWGGVTYGFICRKFSGINTKICMPEDGFCSDGDRKKNKQ